MQHVKKNNVNKCLDQVHKTSSWVASACGPSGDVKAREHLRPSWAGLCLQNGWPVQSKLRNDPCDFGVGRGFLVLRLGGTA